jgi:D-sedoheptulose 7-phosphate isomerase
MKKATASIIEKLVRHYPELAAVTPSLTDAFKLCCNTIDEDGVIYLCGNGGSAADCEHIVGELMKKFKLDRPLSDEEIEKFVRYGKEGAQIAAHLQKSFRAVSLISQTSILSAYINDECSDTVFAQLVYGYGRKNDILMSISTSGNSKNVVNSVIAAKILGIKTIGLTGATGGRLSDLSDCCIKAPSDETNRIQEYHVPIYHCLCEMLESEYFSK